MAHPYLSCHSLFFFFRWLYRWLLDYTSNVPPIDGIGHRAFFLVCDIAYYPSFCTTWILQTNNCAQDGKSSKLFTNKQYIHFIKKSIYRITWFISMHSYVDVRVFFTCSFFFFSFNISPEISLIFSHVL